LGEQHRGVLREAKDQRIRGGLFFGNFLSATQKKVTRHQAEPVLIVATTLPQPLIPTFSPKGEKE
jgi:hypothetical protein